MNDSQKLAKVLKIRVIKIRKVATVKEAEGYPITLGKALPKKK